MAAESLYRDLARLRFPNASPITGSGLFALVSRCPERPFIRLYELAMEVEPAVRQPCAHAFCKMNHQLVRLDEKQPKPRFVKKPHWAKMIEEEG